MVTPHCDKGTSLVQACTATTDEILTSRKAHLPRRISYTAGVAQECTATAGWKIEIDGKRVRSESRFAWKREARAKWKVRTGQGGTFFPSPDPNQVGIEALEVVCRKPGERQRYYEPSAAQGEHSSWTTTQTERRDEEAIMVSAKTRRDEEKYMRTPR
nr:hypothetical protein CFP56_64827 [Quercus suber]